MLNITVLAVALGASPPAATPSSTPGAVNGPHGFEVGTRLGYALPLGDLDGDRSFGDFARGMVPLQLDLGYRFTPHWFAGAYFQFGFVSVKDGACGGTGCSAKDLRFGVDVQYHLFPDATFDPWAGVGVGYELTPVSVSVAGVSGSETFRGLEFVNLALGADYKIAPTLGVGPFIGLSLGQFSSRGDAGDISSKGTHMWLTFGVRSVFDVM